MGNFCAEIERCLLIIKLLFLESMRDQEVSLQRCEENRVCSNEYKLAMYQAPLRLCTLAVTGPRGQISLLVPTEVDKDR